MKIEYYGFYKGKWVEKVLKVKKSSMFTCLTVTLRKTVIKPNFAKILRFSLKKGGSQAGVYPISTLRVSMDTPAFDPPFFNSENAKLPLNWVFQLLSATVTVKQVNKELFLIFQIFQLL